jgi:hypothetical protein
MLGRVESLPHLAAQGGNINSVDPKKRTPLLLSAEYGQWDCLTWIVDCGKADLNAADEV